VNSELNYLLAILNYYYNSAKDDLLLLFIFESFDSGSDPTTFILVSVLLFKISLNFDKLPFFF